MIRSMEEFTSAFQAARCVSTPLVAIRTADPASTTHFIIETLKQGRASTATRVGYCPWPLCNRQRQQR